MKIGVLGAGAMGGIVAIGLHRGGQDVTIIDPWKPHVEAIRTTGFWMTGHYGSEPVEWRGVIPAVHIDELDRLEDSLDVVFVAVKGYNTRWAVERIRPHLADDAMVVSIQNGVNEPAIAEIVGPERTIGAETLMSGQIWEPGHIHRMMGGVPGVMDYMIGEYTGAITPRVERLGEIIRECVGTCGVSDHVMDEVWTKFVVNCGGNLLAAVTSWDTRELSLNNTARLRWALQDEAITVGENLGIKFGNFAGSVGVVLTPADIKAASRGERPDLEAGVIEQAKKQTIVTRPSTLHDALKGTPMEVEELNGYLVKQADELEVPVPYNKALVRVGRLVNDQVIRPYPSNLALFREYIEEEQAAIGG